MNNIWFELLSSLFLRLTVEFNSEVSKTEGRVGQTTNMVIGGTVTDDSTDEWLTLDQKVDITFIFRLH